MPFDLTNTSDQNLVSQLIDEINAAVASGDATDDQRRYLLGHIISLAASDDETEVRKWLTPRRIDEWREKCRTV